MATQLSAIFGPYITVSAQPRQNAVQTSAYPGVHGITGMNMGTRGYPVTITGRLYATGASYAIARAAMDAIKLSIEALYTAGSADYEHMGSSYPNLYLESFQLVPGPDGKAYRGSGGYLFADFVAVMRGMT